MTWSALTTASSASGSTSATSAAASPTALAVSRATGSRISRSARSSGSAARTRSPYRAAVHTQIRSAGSTARSRSNASASRLCAPPSGAGDDVEQLLGALGAGQRPQPRAGAAGHDHCVAHGGVLSIGRSATAPAPRAAPPAGQLVGRPLRLRARADPGAHVGDAASGRRGPARSAAAQRRVPAAAGSGADR